MPNRTTQVKKIFLIVFDISRFSCSGTCILSGLAFFTRICFLNWDYHDIPDKALAGIVGGMLP